MQLVIVKRNSGYNKALNSAIHEITDTLFSGRIKRGDYVVVKPNFLSPAPPSKAILTHPLVLRAVCEYLLESGARVQVSDSPAIGSFGKVLKEGGFSDSLSGLDVLFKGFKESCPVDVGTPFGKIEVARDVIEADHVVNLPKLKTHSQMLLTLGVKNLFGCIVGMRKPEWHLRTGIDRYRFAELLILLAKKINPAVTILDGILAMEGEGPGKRGRPRSLDVIMGSSDPVSLDIAVCRMIGLDPLSLLTNKVAVDRGLPINDPPVDGKIPEVKNFELPTVGPVVFGPRMLHGFMRRHLIEKPALKGNTCRLCGECREYCPAGAIGLNERTLHFDYDQCIRCYCCVEVCPHGALGVAEPLVGRIARKILKKNIEPDAG